MKTTRIILALAIALAVAGSVVLSAAPRGQGPVASKPAPNAPTTDPTDQAWTTAFWGPGPLFGRLAQELGLTDDQIAQLRQIQLDFLTATQADRTELLAKVKEMAQLWSADPPNISAIKSLAAEINEIRGRLCDAAIDRMASALNVLTPDQRQKLRPILKTRWPLCGCCMGCGVGFGPGSGLGLGPGAGMGPRGGGRGMGPGWGNGTGPRGGTPLCPLTR